MLWLAGAALDGDQRLLLWIPALAVDLAAPVAGYWLPGRGRAATTDYDIEGNHFAERCQLFIIIALGESIVVTGATAADAGLTSTVVLCLVVAFLETAALWWLYFGAAEERSRAAMSASDDPGRLARDAYTYLHLPIVAGIIATAVGSNLLIGDPGEPQHGVGLAMMLGGPALFLLGDNLFQRRLTSNDERQALDGRGAAHPALSARRLRRGPAARRDRDDAAGGACGVGVRSSRISTRGKPLSTESVLAAFVNPARSKSPRVPTKAIVRSTFSPRLSTGYPSIAGAPRSRANSTAPRSRWCEMPSPRCPGRTLMHHTDHTATSSTCGILRLRANVVSARGATAAQPTTSSPS